MRVENDVNTMFMYEILRTKMKLKRMIKTHAKIFTFSFNELWIVLHPIKFLVSYSLINISIYSEVP